MSLEIWGDQDPLQAWGLDPGRSPPTPRPSQFPRSLPPVLARWMLSPSVRWVQSFHRAGWCGLKTTVTLEWGGHFGPVLRGKLILLVGENQGISVGETRGLEWGLLGPGLRAGLPMVLGVELCLRPFHCSHPCCPPPAAGENEGPGKRGGGLLGREQPLSGGRPQPSVKTAGSCLGARRVPNDAQLLPGCGGTQDRAGVVNGGL